MNVSRAQVMKWLGQKPAAKPRKIIGTGDVSLYKKWHAEMSREPGIFLPIRIYSEANMRDTWGIIKRKKKTRQCVVIGAGHLIARFAEVLPVEVKLLRYGKRKLDSDNLARAFKAVRDEVAKILGVDDGDESRVRFTYSQEQAKHYGIRIVIERTTS